VSEGPSYVEAMAELEAILRELESDDVDVDVLGVRVARAAELIRLCRDRLGAARVEIEQVLSDLDDD
jgi:exodeoxyribonuclease VII small subunit